MKHKAYILDDGQALFLDPSLDIENMIKQFYPNFKIITNPPPKSYIPNLKKLSKISIPGMDENDIGRCSVSELWHLHNDAIKSLNSIVAKELGMSKKNINILDIKIELSKRILLSCNLCGWNCNVNRFDNMGKCGLREKAYCSTPFVHICEEAPINPAVNIKVVGCSWRCIYCQAYDHIEGWEKIPDLINLNSKTWNTIEDKNANTIEFVGGNPIESIPGILEFLYKVPENFNLPIVWDDNAYGSKEAYDLLNGIVDVYLPDFRYGNNECAKKLSGIEHYWETAVAGFQNMIGQNAKIIVRILVLPGHFTCCHKKVLEWLSKFRDRLWISILDQYIPEYKAFGDPVIGRMATMEEVAEVERLAVGLGLRDINKDYISFWR